MRYRNLGRAGIKVSEVGLGTMGFGRWIDERQSERVLQTALDLGINFIDTANRYGRGQDTGDYGQLGESEAILGRLLKGRRDEVVLATKVCNPMGPGPNERGLSRKHILSEVENSLRRLQTDYIDLYVTHGPDPETPREETLRALDDLVRAGKVRYIGCSNLAAWEVCKALWVSDRRNLTPFVSVQPEYSILRRGIEEELLPLCREEGLAVTVYSPLARGLLSGKYTMAALHGEFPAHSRGAYGEARLHALLNEINLKTVEALRSVAAERGQTLAQLALSWVLAQDGVTCAIVGATDPDRLGEVVGALEKRMDKACLENIKQIQVAVREARV